MYNSDNFWSNTQCEVQVLTGFKTMEEGVEFISSPLATTNYNKDKTAFFQRQKHYAIGVAHKDYWGKVGSCNWEVLTQTDSEFIVGIIYYKDLKPYNSLGANISKICLDE